MRTVLTNFYEDGWDLDVLADIRQKTIEYAKLHGLIDCRIIHVSDNSKMDDINIRYDVDIVYHDSVTGNRAKGKLLYMKGEIIDAQEFYKRYQEFYGDREDWQVI